MKRIILFISGAFSILYLDAQGCSDAGFCTIGNLKPTAQNIAVKQKLSIGITNGVGDENVFVSTPSVQYDNQLSKQWAIQAKFTANYASGNLANVFGLGDLFVSGNYSTTNKQQWQTSYLVACKFPLNEGNLKKNHKSLPMQYQSSLGTVDAIAACSITNETWTFATAIQQPLTGINRNNFLPAYWNDEAAKKYAPGNDFNRKADVLVKANYATNKNKLWQFNVGLLGIYHLGKDTYIDGNISNQPIAIAGSDGLTLNATAAVACKLNKKINLVFIAGKPLVVRTIRPDGLTRQFSISTELAYSIK